MPEYLINFRNCATGELAQVHICNVDSVESAVVLASNSVLTEDILDYDSAYLLIHRNPNSLGIPF